MPVPSFENTLNEAVSLNETKLNLLKRELLTYMSEVLRKSGSAPTLSCVVPSLTPCGERT